MTTSTAPPTLSDFVFEVGDLVTGLVVLAPILPGFLLCIPGLLLAAFVVAVPVIALVLLVLAGSILVMPYFLVRFLVRRWSARTVVKSRTSVGPDAVVPAIQYDAPGEYAFEV
jgi:hypothetical protein